MARKQSLPEREKPWTKQEIFNPVILSAAKDPCTFDLISLFPTFSLCSIPVRKPEVLSCSQHQGVLRYAQDDKI
jgi:hypothetical protein